ncbi:hypothetical protein CHUAL_011194 [Chamberlinius hualienensis]
MVFFACNTCGAALKKNQVQNHIFNCRCGSVSCMDCGKDFLRDSYNYHNKCISEAEKYNGKNFTAKPSALNARLRQDQLKESIGMVLENNKKLTVHVKQTLEMLHGMDNVPKKQSKFENFMRSLLPNVSGRDAVTVEIWNLISESMETLKESKLDSEKTEKTENGDQQNNQVDNERTKKPKKEFDVDNLDETNSEILTEVVSEKKKKKKDRQKVDVEIPESADTPEVNGGEEEVKKKRKKHHTDESEMEEKSNKKKRKDKLENETDDIPAANGTGKDKKSKKEKAGMKAEEKSNGDEVGDISKADDKRRKRRSLENQENCVTETDENIPVKKSKKNKFKWTDAIISVLNERENHEISLKKLQKKVGALYKISCPDETQTLCKEDLIATLRKKIGKSSHLELNEEIVKLLL